MLKNAILQNFESQGILIDGFPQSMDQVLEFQRVIGTPKTVICFHCPQYVLEERMIQSGFSNDIQTIEKKYTKFQEEGSPVIDYYQETGKVIKVFSIKTISTIPFPDEVFRNVLHLVDFNRSPLPFSNLKIIFVLGGPGSGKGTQCEILVSQKEYAHISTGDILRNELKKKTEIGRKAESLMSQGKMIPTVLSC